jgi:hypothetical protein
VSRPSLSGGKRATRAAKLLSVDTEAEDEEEAVEECGAVATPDADARADW